MQAMIFAAGIGSRLKPWTDHDPKALVPVNGVPVLQHVLLRIAATGIARVIINVHHFADKIIDFIEANNGFGLDITISDERHRLLDTGGGLKQAARHIADSCGPLLVHNADIYSDLDLGSLIDTHVRGGGDVTLAVSERDSSRKLYANVRNRLVGWQNITTGQCRPAGFDPQAGECSAIAFTGIHMLNPDRVMPLLTACSDDVFGIIPFYLDNLNRLDIICHHTAPGTHWHDIGRPESLKAANDSPIC